MELAVCLNKAQATKAVKQAEVCCTATACILQQAHRDSVLALAHQMKAEERRDCQAFMEALWTAI